MTIVITISKCSETLKARTGLLLLSARNRTCATNMKKINTSVSKVANTFLKPCTLKISCIYKYTVDKLQLY